MPSTLYRVDFTRHEYGAGVSDSPRSMAFVSRPSGLAMSCMARAASRSRGMATSLYGTEAATLALMFTHRCTQYRKASSTSPGSLKLRVWYFSGPKSPSVMPYSLDGSAINHPIRPGRQGPASGRHRSTPGHHATASHGRPMRGP